ncbi:DUF6783 domain-containing protein [Ruminococcus sp. Marseille-P328]
MKKFRSLHAPLCGIFHPDSGKISTNCDVHLAESLFQTRAEKK